MRGKPAVFLLVTVLLAFGAVASVCADTLHVRYVEGAVSVERHNVWIALDVGSTVDTGATVQIGPNGYLELADGDMVLRLSRPGTFRVDQLLSGRIPRTADTVLSRVLSLLTSLTRDQSPRATAVAGTRADGPEDIGAIEWVGGESTLELIERGRRELAEGRVDTAVDLFDEAALYADAQDEAIADFYFGYALFLQGEVRDALHYLTLHEPTREQDFYDEHVIVLAHTYLALSDPEPAISLLTTFLSTSSDEHPLRSTAHLLSGMAYRMAGDSTAAREALLRVVEIAPELPEADVAAELLSEL